jgi:5,6-dimethylbenzimidazole synthase
MPGQEALSPFAFAPDAVEAVYRAIWGRRDIRQFRSDPLPEAVLWRLLDAAHHAPSVGFMQPWNFIVVRDRATKAQVKDLYERERLAAAQFYDEPRRSQFLSLKLEGILEAPVNVCVTCNPTRGGTVLGRNSVPETDVYSCCLAVENLWLAARAEGVGVGWVSILKIPLLRRILGIPPHVIPVAYLCLGVPVEFPPEPTLQSAGWRDRLTLTELVYQERWGGDSPSGPDDSSVI